MGYPLSEPDADRILDSEDDPRYIEWVDEQNQIQLRKYAVSIWQWALTKGDPSHPRTPLRRLRKLIELIETIEKRGPYENDEVSLRLSAMLEEWGPVETLRMLCLAAENKL